MFWVSSVATGFCSFGRRFDGLWLVVVFGESIYIVLIEQIVDPDLAHGLELEDDPNAGEVHSLSARQETNDTNALDIRLTVETEVVTPLRAEESLLLVDAQRARMAARQLCGDADDVAGASESVSARNAGR
jgi:hypothetical protein